MNIDRRKKGPKPPKIAPKLLKSVPPPPKELGHHGKEEWKRIIGLLVQEELITVFDTQEVLLACMEWETFLKARGVVQEKGITWESPKTGYPQARPEVAIENQAFKNYSAKLVLFGMNPTARSKMERVVPVDDGKNPFSEI